MGGKLIVIAGYLAAGKSTFARRLGKELGVPCFVKDTFKSALCESVSITDRAESSRFSAVTFDAMCYAAERLLEAGLPVILEGNFTPPGVKPTDEAGRLRDLAARYGAPVLAFRFQGDTTVLHQRFLRREGTPERGEANRMFEAVSWETFDRLCRNLEGVELGGETVDIDATDFAAVNFETTIACARRFLEEGSPP